jgi:hypothetical protein
LFAGVVGRRRGRVAAELPNDALAGAGREAVHLALDGADLFEAPADVHNAGSAGVLGVQRMPVVVFGQAVTSAPRYPVLR